MRKYDVFGKKISQAKVFYYLFFIFLVLIGGYLLVTQIQNRRYDDLIAEERVIQRQIDSLLQNTNTDTFYEIGEIIQYLPNQFDQNKIHLELEYVKNVSGLALAQNYQVSYLDQANNPFSETLSSTIRFVRISISFQTDMPINILDYMNHLYEQDRLYYISQLNVIYQLDGTAVIQALIFTFYNEVALT